MFFVSGLRLLTKNTPELIHLGTVLQWIKKGTVLRLPVFAGRPDYSDPF